MGINQSSMPTSLDLRLQAREALKLQSQCEREEVNEKEKVKRSLEKGNMEAARIHAGNAIRKHNEALRYLQYHSKLEILRSQVESAERTNALNEQLKEALPRLSKMTKYKSNGNTNLMQELEKIFDDLDVSEAYGDMTMNSVNAHLAPQNEVDNLISKVADEYALDIGDMLNASRVIGSSLSNRNIGRLTQ
ncbi:uncharacterized protein BBOV_IV005900 [Babesia bovis T2Bo]|uniref:Uncharacterized protein n=1 Tax=Babesia bovis TaxID=5865 RepID=A7AQY2_BABBO|nr:uncharacterized protein BBOV_IV005900 [Babesia bovis T2Bo]EDO06951.1 hypothetical protein BBOV_IV005900 [Babesia bovis T2Bo]BAN65823.1 conserved hypothetical protein [Babesia bovis]|eukprot:XP_001610519.1 hypothetical protein [Babesia bovis T2Bo]